MAIASVSWASLEIEPYDIAPVANRLTISLAGSTSSSGTDGSLALKSSRPRSVSSCVCWSSISFWYFRNSSRLLICVACWSFETTSGERTWASPLRRHW